jgi:predicted metal-dependent HD superfamily phosphohydrolase
MFETIFKAELVAINIENLLIDKLWSQIESNYSQPNRHYHNLSHLDSLVSELLTIKTNLIDWQTIVLSIAYHAIVYNILRQNNEEKSSDFAVKSLKLLRIPESKITACKHQILATKNHNISSDNDINYFIDADLAILGADPETYEAYTQKIRKEYKFYPDLIYNPGRKKVLSHFLQMAEIYKTQYFASKYEQLARKNIEEEFRKLE